MPRQTRPRKARLARSFAAVGLAAGLTAALAGPARADIPFDFSFETEGFTDDVYDFTASPDSGFNVPSNGGLLGLPSPHGSFHIEVEADFGVTQTRFGGLVDTYVGDFYQAIDMYVDPATWTIPADDDEPGLVLSSVPRNIASFTDFNGEQRIEFLVSTNGQIDIRANSDAVFASIDEAGWYTFVVTYRKGVSGTDPVLSDFFVYDSDLFYALQPSLIGSALGVAAPSSMQSQDLGGNGFAFSLSQWQVGFAGDVLAFDHVRTGIGAFPLPEPASVALLAAGGLLLLRRR